MSAGPLEEEKLRLEIEELKRRILGSRSESDMLKRFEKYIPLISVIIAVGGFSFSVWQYASTQQVERRKETQKQVRSELEVLLKHTKDDVPSPSQIVLSLNNLYELTLDDPGKSSEITDVFKKLFVYDFLEESSLSDSKVRFENLFMDYWPDYRHSLDEDPESNIRLLARYLRKIKGEKFGSNTFDSLQGALYRHGKRLINSNLTDQEAKALRRDYYIDQINNYFNNYKFVDGKILSKD